jgi:hypothetical protein
VRLCVNVYCHLVTTQLYLNISYLFFFFFFWSNSGHDLLILDVSRSHTTTHQSVRLLWTSDQLVTETSTWHYTTITKEKLPCFWWDSNTRSQQASGHRPTP